MTPSQKYAASAKGKAARKAYEQTEAYKKSRKRTVKKYDDANRDRQRQYYAENKDQWRNRSLLKTYNLTLDEYNTLLEEQDHSCRVCGTHADETSRNLAVDHCHETGKIRSLLCNKCNTALGLLNEDVDVMKKLIKYVEDHK